MPKEMEMDFRVPVTRLVSTAEDWNAAEPALLESMLVQHHIIRAFEEVVLELAGEGVVHGPAHSSIGQEGAAVGSVLALRPGDGVNGTHRGHHQFIAKGLQYLRADGMSRVDGLKGDDLAEFVSKTLSEILGLKRGFSGGRGGSMHLQWLEAGALGTNAIVGGGVPLAAGNAWAQLRTASSRPNGSDELNTGVTVTYFGDGASNIGSTLETLNLSAAWSLPLCFFIENNKYAVATLIDDVTGEENLALRGPGFGLRAWQVDGMDPLAVYLAQQEAVEYMRTGNGPTLIEANTYRYYHQNGPFPGSAFGYRTKAEESDWRERDPLLRLEREMTSRGLITAEDNSDLAQRVKASIEEVVDALTEIDPESRGETRRVRPHLWPDETSVDAYLRAPLNEGRSVTGTSQLSLERQQTEKFSDVIAATLRERMLNDDGIVLLGEDIHRLKGGTNGATRGLAEEFPDRVLGTPISENAFTGLAGGLSMTGRYRPVLEFMYADFMWVAADQLFNQIGKARHMFGGQSSMPVVLRAKVAMGTGYGSQHSMDPAGVFATSAGWRIVAPSCAQDYAGLMNTALDIDDPVLVLEHVDLYSKKEPVAEGIENYRLPVGRAEVRKSGTDVTILSYLNMVNECVIAAEEYGALNAEVIDLRWLDRASLDWQTIEDSVKKTNSVLIVEQGPQGTSYGAWLADEIQRRLFDYLDQPVNRVTGREASPTISKVLEQAAIAGRREIRAALDTVALGLGRGQELRGR